MVVTEMATPTARAPAVSYASMPATPAARATRTVPGPTSVNDGPSTLSASARSSSIRSSQRSSRVAIVAAAMTTARPKKQRQHRPRRQLPTATEQSDRGGGDRQEIGTQRHRADDEDGG